MSAPRKSAAERREQLVEVALEHFAHGGYEGTSTEAIARDAGISQPYLFRLFGTKRELFIACCARHHEVVAEIFSRAAEGVPQADRLERMGEAYGSELLPDRRLLLFQMQSYGACSDAEIRTSVRAGYVRLVEHVAALAGRAPADVWGFFATGMMLNVVASLELEAIADETPWAAGWDRPHLVSVDPGD